MGKMKLFYFFFVDNLLITFSKNALDFRCGLCFRTVEISRIFRLTFRFIFEIILPKSKSGNEYMKK